MIKSISMLGNTEAPGSISNVAQNKPQGNAKPAEAPVKDTFVPSAENKNETIKPDPNDKFEKNTKEENK